MSDDDFEPPTAAAAQSGGSAGDTGAAAPGGGTGDTGAPAAGGGAGEAGAAASGVGFLYRGRVWKYGDNVDTDVIIPARHLNTTDPAELAKHCLEDLDPGFAAAVRPGDVIVAGRNFGCGSSREHAPLAIKGAGVSCVVAETFARIFFRNAINIGLPIFEAPDAVREAETGDVLEVDGTTGVIRNLTQGREYRVRPLPPFIQEIVRAGGLMARLRAPS